MGIELLIVLIVVLGGVAVWYFNKDASSADLNSDGKTDLADAKIAVENTVAGLKAAADVNKDGKLDAADAKAVAGKAKKSAKKAAGKVKEATAKKPRTKKQ